MRRDRVAERIRRLSPAKRQLLDRLLEQESYDSSALEADQKAPASSLEAQLVEIWQEVLGVERIGVEESFFDLGGDSILSIRIVAKAQHREIPLTSRLLFEAPTIAQLARHLEPRLKRDQALGSSDVGGRASSETSGPRQGPSRDRRWELSPEDFPEADLSPEDLSRVLSRVAARAGFFRLEAPPQSPRRAAAL